VAALMLVTAACGDDDDTSSGTDAPAGTEAPAGSEAPSGTDGGAGGECESLTPVSLQLQWVTQAQFAGYYAAVDQGFYEDQCLDVEILEGGVEIVPQTQLASGAADFAIAWVPKALASIEQGAGITNISQVFQRSGTLQVSWADSGITEPADLEGKKVGNWGFGNEFELFAGLTEAGLSPEDVELVQQNFDMQALLNKEIDAAQAMTYNEYAQLLEATNPDTGELYTPEDFSVINWNDVGTAMLQDAIWASTERLQNEPEYRDTAVRFVAASLQGWAFCRDDPEACVDIVVAQGSALGQSHQLWQMNEINKLIWPSPADGVGTMDPALWDQTVQVSLNAQNDQGSTVITQDPPESAYVTDINAEAIAMLIDMGVDVVGENFTEIEVTLNEGGS
jgi:NitT/TauT family transport system substrate-binding protein